MTTQTHSFGQNAAMILGLRIRAIDVDVTVATDNTGLTSEGCSERGPRTGITSVRFE